MIIFGVNYDSDLNKNILITAIIKTTLKINKDNKNIKF